MAFVSEEFVADAECQQLFVTAQDRLKKEVMLAMVGQGRDWQSNSVLGGHLVGKVGVNKPTLQ